MDSVGVKKRLEDYEKMQQYYILMRTKNKMKDFEVKFEEWLEVVEEYFTKEIEKNLAQHRTDKNILKYKLEAYQENFLDFIYGNPTSIEVSGHNEMTKARPNGIAQEEEMKTKKP
jgi:hypothetical protein